MPKKLTREFMLSRIMAYDIISIMSDVEKGDLTYLISWLIGEGIVQYNNLSDKAVEEEYNEGEYLNQNGFKQKLFRESPHAEHPFIANLLKTGKIEGSWVNDRAPWCRWIGPKDPEYKRLNK